MPLSRLVEAAFLPPGVLILCLLVLGTWLFSRRRVAGGLCFAIAGLLYLLSVQPVAMLLSSPLERAFAPPSARELSTHADAPIVVLGGGFLPATPAGPALSEMGTARLLAGVRLQRRLGGPLVFSGGAPLRSGRGGSEAETAAELAVSLGVPASQILVEPLSRTTAENARLTGELLKARGTPGDRVILVTSAFHIPRARFAFLSAGFDPLPFPTAYAVSDGPLRIWDFLPSASAFYLSSRALREYLALGYYRLLL
jgi:uncharacterized SAM-binding protein YcdF (DUF218 family)